MVHLRQDNLSEIVAILQNHNVVAMPTDTVYGLVCIFNDEKAIELIYKIKNRSRSKQLAVLVSSWKEAQQLADLEETQISYLVKNFVPGQVTVVAKKKLILNNDNYWSKFSTIAIRVCSSKLIKDVIKKVGPLVATSVNLSGEQPVNDFKAIDLPFLDYIVVSDEVSNNKPSTIYNSITKKIIRE